MARYLRSAASSLLIAAIAAASAGLASATPASAATGFTVSNGFASYQPGGGSTTPVPVQFDALTLAAGGTAAASSLSITGQPASGTAAANTTTGIITYSPTASTTGNQTVTFSLCESGTTDCPTATLTEGPGVAVNNAFIVPELGGYASYGSAYGAFAPAGAGSGSTFTVYFAPTAVQVPSSLSLNGVTATVNDLDALNYVLPIPANATYVSGSAQVIGGDANTDSGSEVTLCTATGGTGACSATPVSSTFPTETTVPYLELQMPSNLDIKGGTDVTPPTVVAQFTASGAPGATIEPQVTEFDAGANVTVLGSTITGTLATYPVSPSFTSAGSGSTAPPYFAYPLSTTTIQSPPAVTGISPSSGPTAGETTVTITGTNLGSATAVSFGTTAATSFKNVSASSITAVSPAGTGTVNVEVTTPDGTSAATAADQFTYLSGPTITSISPTSGPVAGGNAVTISGTNLLGATAVDFGTAAAVVTSDTATSITATAPASSGAGSVDVSVPTAAGSATANQQYTYVVPPPAPAVSGFSPTSGSVAGGTPVTITGSNLANATVVDFGTVAATVTADTATSITATSPPGSGTVTISVTTLGGTATSSSGFTYMVPPGFPTVTALSPTGGPTTGGTTVTVTGTNLLGATAVDFGSQPAAFSGVTATSLTAQAPAGTGAVEVTVTTPSGTSIGTAAGTFTYAAPAPTVTALTPSSGPAAGESLVTIDGTNLSGATSVSFGSTAAAILVPGLDALTVLTPPGSGTVAVTVTTPAGTSALGAADQYTYVAAAAPTVTAISPSSGPAAGGTTVTVTGTNFSGLTQVAFGGVPAAVTAVTATTVTAISPAGTPGTVDVTVTGPSGTSPASAADQFSYLPVLPAVTGVAPASGPSTGGTTVTITGSNLLFATAVHFGTAAATLVGDTATSVTVRSPAGSSTVDVTVTTPAGTSATSTSDHFTYNAKPPAPALTGSSPKSGPTTGGTLVKLTGTNLLHTSAVLFGKVKARFKEVTATSLYAYAPAGTGKVTLQVTTTGGTSKVVTAAEFTYVVAARVRTGAVAWAAGQTRVAFWAAVRAVRAF